MPPKKIQTKKNITIESTTPGKSLDTFLVSEKEKKEIKETKGKTSQKKSQSNSVNSSLSKSKSKKIEYDENGVPIIKLIFQENLLKSLNKIYERQNHELLKIISIEKTIPINDLMNFMDDQSSIFIKSID